MTEWPDSAGFSDRHAATMDLMRVVKATLNLPQAELSKTARDLEEECLKGSKSKDDYLRLVNERKTQLERKFASSKKLKTTTGESSEPGAEVRDLGKYEVVYHARSLNSVIYRVAKPASDATSVLKVVAVSSQIAPHDIEKETEFFRRMQTKSPNIIPFLGVEQLAGGLLAIKLEYMPYDLSSLAEQNVLSPQQKRSLLRDMFEALTEVHKQGIIHRDIKPSNILLSNPDGSAYLTDFGISWHIDVNTEEAADAKILDVGTGCYRAPEVLFGCHSYTNKFDMWAAGCTMAEVLRGSGKTLFDAGPISREDFLGSDLRLINSMFQTKGTPTDETWPEAKTFRDWGKISFKEFPAKPWPELLPAIDDDARDVLSKLVEYESGNRLSAAEVLKHPYFQVSG